MVILPAPKLVLGEVQALVERGVFFSHGFGRPQGQQEVQRAVYIGGIPLWGIIPGCAQDLTPGSVPRIHP